MKANACPNFVLLVPQADGSIIKETAAKLAPRQPLIRLPSASAEE
jgi:hypothetical protein